MRTILKRAILRTLEQRAYVLLKKAAYDHMLAAAAPVASHPRRPWPGRDEADPHAGRDGGPDHYPSRPGSVNGCICVAPTAARRPRGAAGAEEDAAAHQHKPSEPKSGEPVGS
jgi:hypothetical protein